VNFQCHTPVATAFPVRYRRQRERKIFTAVARSDLTVLDRSTLRRGPPIAKTIRRTPMLNKGVPGEYRNA
jgi:hypothetical protein